MLVLNGSMIPIEYFIDPPISVVSNEILSRCYIPLIQFLVILFPSGVATIFVSSNIFLRQVRNVVLVFCSIFVVCILFNCFAHILFKCFACVLFDFFCSRFVRYPYLPRFSHKEFYDIPDGLPHFHFFYPVG